MTETLFDFADRYPFVPGTKSRDTSALAAEAMKAKAPTLRDQVFDVIRAGQGSTADEVAEALGKSVLSCRPRLSELCALDKIEDTGARRPNASGVNAIVWRARA